MKLNNIEVGQIVKIKSLDECIKKGYVIQGGMEWDFDEFRVTHNPGLEKEMINYFGKIVTIKRIGTSSGSPYIDGYFWPKECIEPIIQFKNIKLI